MEMHLTGFMIYCPAPHTMMSWVYPKEKIRHQWYEVGYWEEIARTLEEGCFDMFFLADGWGGGNEVDIFADVDKVDRFRYEGTWYRTAGRDAQRLRVLWSASPIVAPTEAEARERQAEIADRIPLEASVAMVSGHLNLNLSTFHPDTKLSLLEGTVDGTQGIFDLWHRNGEDPTIAEAARRYGSGGLGRNSLLGTPAQVADEMITILSEGGGHGFQLTPPYYAPDYYRDLVDLLVPELQRRGVYRTSYSTGTLRDRMGGGLAPAWTRPAVERR